MARRVSFWLLPSASDRDVFQPLITQLAQTYDAPVFAPHVTIYSGDYAVDEMPDALLARAIQGVGPITLEVDSIHYTEQLTKTVFVQFQPNESLAQLSDQIQQQSATPSGYQLDPHLSLIYQRLPEAEKQRLAESIGLSQVQITFDAVGGIVTSRPTLSREDVENWSLQWEMSLEG